MAPEVKCSVSNCNYWDNMYCIASAIEVNADDGGVEAPTSDSTCCDTFKPSKYAGHE